MNSHELVLNIQALSKQLDVVSNPHRASELAVEMSVLLACLNEPLYQLELRYQLLRGEKYNENLDNGMKPTPAKDSLEFSKGLIELRLELEKFKEFVRSHERLVNRVENHLRNAGNMERRGV